MKDGANIDVLVVEGSPTQSARACLALADAGMSTVAVATLADATAALAKQTFDAIVLDLVLPDASDLSAVIHLHALAPATPIVVQTSIEDEELAIAALQRGAQDYVIKSHDASPHVLPDMVRFAIDRARGHAELEHLTATLRAKNEELDLLNKQKDRFIGIAAHDLRNPLGVVLGYCDLLLSGAAGELRPDQTQIVRTVQSSARYMLGLVDDLLDFSAIQAHGIQLELSPTDLPALVRDTVSLQRLLASRKSISIGLEPLPDLPPITLDARKTRQVLENLISNAVKFSHEGSHVRVSLTSTQDHVTLSVSDRGVGIAPDELDRLFQPFSKTSARAPGGERSTGLGLAIVHNIVTAHGGRLHVESELGRGSTFHVELRWSPPTTQDEPKRIGD